MFFSLKKITFSLLFSIVLHWSPCVVRSDGSWKLCFGNQRECFVEEVIEMEMNSETNRRVALESQSKYISYRSLKSDEVPCSTPGSSYYNCHVLGKPSNPYKRGCTVITGCRSDVKP